jgi:hypothetical protein
MKESLTGQEMIEFFKTCSEKYSKLFIPDSPRQEDVANSLIKHYDSDLLKQAIEWYIKAEPGPFLVFDFAIRSRDFVEKVKYENESINRFKQIVADTKKRLENS